MVLNAGLPVADSNPQPANRPDRIAHGTSDFRCLVEGLPAAIYTCDLAGRITFFNRAAAELWGREPRIGRDLWCGSWQIYQPDGMPLPHDACPLALTLRDDRAMGGVEIIVERPDGSRRHVLAHPEPLRDEAGALIGAVSMLLDVTPYRQAERALHESEERFRTVAMNAPAAIYVKDIAGRYTLANPLACQALGKPQGVEGLTDHDLLPAEIADRLHQHDAEVVETGGVVEYEESLKRDGFFAEYLSVKFPLFDAQGRAAGVCGVSTDITARKRAESARREIEERFVRFMHHLPGLAWIKDSSGRYVFANEAAASAFQVTASELIGRHDTEIFSAEAAAQFIENDRLALASENGIQTVEGLVHGDGETHYSLVSKFPIPAPDGASAWIGGMAIDITDRKRAEESLREADRRKDEFLAILAHELRNPLAPIRTGLELLRISGDDAALSEEILAMLDRQSLQMVRLIDDLLDVSRITRGALELRTSRVELATVIEQAVEAARPFVEEQGHRLHVEIPPQPITLEADASRLAQVVSNLLNNAAKYMSPGGEVRLTVDTRGDQAVVRVIDRGIGIPVEMLESVFEMFTQVDRSLERTQGGLGIGLTLVKRLVEMHGGTVEARSDGRDRGSEFVVTLPRASAVGAVGAREPSNNTNIGGRRILVVDDNDYAARILSLLLKSFGNEVRTAHDGLAAVEMAAQYLPDVVFMDLGMPKLNGYDAARRIRQQTWGGQMILVALTGWGQDEDRARTRAAGFNEHFVKPIDSDTLRSFLVRCPLRGR
jgi:PAS domain S-box-containing protein